MKKPRMLLNQRFVAVFMNIVYTAFYARVQIVDLAVFLYVWFVLHFA